jgi:predicted secreted hydrolase
MFYFALLFWLFSFYTSAKAQNDFAKVNKPWEWKFPRDHGKHPEYQTEWWYFTGNLQVENGRRFGHFEMRMWRTSPSPTSRMSAFIMINK